MTDPTLLLVTVDVEEAWDWSGPYPTSRYCVEHIARLPEFQASCDRFGMRPTYFTNYAVMNDRAAGATMQSLGARESVELAMHIHPWNTPPVAADAPVQPRDTFLHNRPEAEIHEKLAATYRAFRDRGATPRSFRGGRYSTGGAIHTFLRSHGFVADCSIVPFARWHEDGAPDFRNDGPMPRRLPPTGQHPQALWEIPQSAGFTRGGFESWARLYRGIEDSAFARLHLIGAAERLGLVRRVWLNFEMGETRDWIPFVRRLQRMRVPVVSLTVHSSSLFAGPGPYTRDRSDELRIHERIARVFGELAALDGVVPATAAEAAARLERVAVPRSAAVAPRPRAVA